MLAGTGGCQRPLLQCIINSQSLEDTQKYTLDKYTLEKYALAQEKLGDGGDLLGDDVNLLGDGGNLHCWGVIKDDCCTEMSRGNGNSKVSFRKNTLKINTLLENTLLKNTLYTEVQK